ncbi:hypothetical protein [Parvularcula lutaonensis]|uniref:Lipoprotein n=1 Tax=Parvularcula lutaonensis TaxID=491923 RepID=A0ABV7MCQ8_9PROT|nr:hypothetical protein [Parvularcula lutaonensis]GGY49524.1 hypothetical protein GCM10007148_17670 [Parvularcula lutaonensis]
MIRTLACMALGTSLAACSQAVTIGVENDTVCTFRQIEGYKVHPRSGEYTLVFAIEEMQPLTRKPIYFKLDWEGELAVSAESPDQYITSVYVTPGITGYTLPLSPAAPADCLRGAVSGD